MRRTTEVGVNGVHHQPCAEGRAIFALGAITIHAVDFVVSPFVREGVLGEVVGELLDIRCTGVIADVPCGILHRLRVLQRIRGRQRSIDLLVGRYVSPQRRSRSEQRSELLQVSPDMSVDIPAISL